MIRWGKTIVIECDQCNEEFEGDPGEQWETLWPRAKRKGWKSRRVSADLYTHGCPEHEA